MRHERRQMALYVNLFALPTQFRRPIRYASTQRAHWRPWSTTAKHRFVTNTGRNGNSLRARQARRYEFAANGQAWRSAFCGPENDCLSQISRPTKIDSFGARLGKVESIQCTTILAGPTLLHRAGPRLQYSSRRFVPPPETWPPPYLHLPRVTGEALDMATDW